MKASLTRSLLAISLIIVGCSYGAPGTSPSPAPPSPTAPASAGPTATAVPTVRPSPTSAPGSGEACDPDMGYGCYTAVPTTGGSTATPGTSGDVELSMSADGYLVGPNGHSLYMFDNDSPGTSACDSDCAGNWPPLVVATTGSPVAAAGCCSGELGTITRQDGSRQVTLGDRPLYYYGGDGASGDTNGDGLFGVWHLARP